MATLADVTFRFSERTSWDLTESGIARAIASVQSAGRPLFDLTISNPTTCGFVYDASELLAPMADPASLRYDPNPHGLLSARRAVVDYYASHRASVSPEQVLLTTSTSEAYSFLFRLLCDPGDEVLVAQPSYPLFDFLADLDDIRLRPYPLFYDFGWWIDFAELECRITPRTRALLLVHPNNPTGHATSAQEREQLEDMCARHHLALIVDEVFLDYGLANPITSFAAGEQACLTFVLSGLSKVAALPQMKVAWLAAFGPERDRTAALKRLEVIADTFLSMNAPAQHALPAWLAGREAMQRQIVGRVRENLALLTAAAPAIGTLLVEAGWAAVVHLPQHLGSADLAERLIEEAGVIVHPGSFYALPGAHRLVVSLLTPVEEFRNGLQNLKLWVNQHS